MKRYSQFSRAQMENALDVFLTQLQAQGESDSTLCAESFNAFLHGMVNIKVNKRNPCLESIQEMLKEQLDFFDKPEIQQELKALGWNYFINIQTG